ncbi:MAG: prepilin-type N-terminal cleavage/methylation domain-containing protein [Pseudomonadota bacterium]
MQSKQSGFTLIEIAIVLVVIGLLLGGVLKGQELIDNAKVKNIANDFKNIPVFIYGYQDKFKALPGDDPAAATHLSGGTAAATPTTSLGNGTINGSWNSATITDESYLFWQHIRLAGFAAGGTTPGAADYAQTNAAGGTIGVQSNAGFTTITKNAAGTDAAMSGTYIICSSGILGKYAKQLDIMLDNGDTDSGSVRVTDSASTTGKSIAATGAGSIQDGNPYTVCMSV